MQGVSQGQQERDAQGATPSRQARGTAAAGAEQAKMKRWEGVSQQAPPGGWVSSGSVRQRGVQHQQQHKNAWDECVSCVGGPWGAARPRGAGNAPARLAFGEGAFLGRGADKGSARLRRGSGAGLGCCDPLGADGLDGRACREAGVGWEWSRSADCKTGVK